MCFINFKSVPTLVQLLLILAITGLITVLFLPGYRPAFSAASVSAGEKSEGSMVITGREGAYSMPVTLPVSEAEPECVAGLFGWIGPKPTPTKNNTVNGSVAGPEVCDFIAYIGRYYTTASERQYFIFKELATSKIIDLRVGDQKGELQLVSVSKEGFLIYYLGKKYLVKAERIITPDYLQANLEQPAIRTPPPVVVVNQAEQNRSEEGLFSRDRQREHSSHTDSSGPGLDEIRGYNRDYGHNYRQQKEIPRNYRPTPSPQHQQGKQNTVSVSATPSVTKPEAEQEQNEQEQKEPSKPVTARHRDDPVINGNFEETVSMKPMGWTTTAADTAHSYWQLEQDANAYEGRNSVMVMNLQPNMAGYQQQVPVSSNRVYRLSGFIKVLEEVKGPGASLSFSGLELDYPLVTGKIGYWQKVEIVGRTAYWVPRGMCRLTLALLLGKENGLSTGKVAFDNIRLEPVDRPGPGLEIVEFYQPVSDANLIRNGSFEFVEGNGGARSWEYRSTENSTDTDIRIASRTDKAWSQKLLSINHGSPDYTRVYQQVVLSSNTVYDLRYELFFPNGTEKIDASICIGDQLLGKIDKIDFAGSNVTENKQFLITGSGSKVTVSFELRLGSLNKPLAGSINFDNIVVSTNYSNPDTVPELVRIRFD